ncbi:unnamed protein product [Vicia faba]|uniref:Uncharacterized protein n=1 Tax=Vicia faba TaxID=3906 RepID=A0AAV0YS52_VICFA|nr:unnamed protein product [Vicia faba]
MGMSTKRMNVTSSITSHMPKAMNVTGSIMSHMPKAMNVTGSIMSHMPKAMKVTGSIATKKNKRNEHLLGRKEIRTMAVEVISGGWCGNLTALQEMAAAESEKEGEARRGKTNYRPKGLIYRDDVEYETSHRGAANFPVLDIYSHR